MGVLVGAVLTAICGFLYWQYVKWQKRGITARFVATSLTPDEIRPIFDRTVAVLGWKIVSDGDPRLAQSPLVTGIRQQIALEMEPNDDGMDVLVSPARWSAKNGIFPRKAHTMRIRLNRCAKALEAASAQKDQSVVS